MALKPGRAARHFPANVFGFPSPATDGFYEGANPEVKKNCSNSCKEAG
jgi:hypothetical protein